MAAVVFNFSCRELDEREKKTITRQLSAEFPAHWTFYDWDIIAKNNIPLQVDTVTGEALAAQMHTYFIQRHKTHRFIEDDYIIIVVPHTLSLHDAHLVRRKVDAFCYTNAPCRLLFIKPESLGQLGLPERYEVYEAGLRQFDVYSQASYEESLRDAVAYRLKQGW